MAYQQQYQSYSSPNQGPVSGHTHTPPLPSSLPPQPPPPTEAVPTVRVMRLYKPCLHTAPTLPYLPSDTKRPDGTEGAGFAITPFLLLPDSFGDIFVGETFSAYIAVLNGSEHTVYRDLTLSVKLQTVNASFDLNDSRPTTTGPPGTAPTLSPGESLDIVVKHTLNEPGAHNLRVTVTYTTMNSRTNELKTQKKYYKFSALEPLHIASSCSELNGKAMVQCQVTNNIKLPVYIEKMNFVPSNKEAVLKFLNAPSSVIKTSNVNGGNGSGSPHTRATRNPSLSIMEDDSLNLLSDEELFNVDSLALLLPNESYAFAFSMTLDRPPAHTATASGSGGTGAQGTTSTTATSRQLGVPEVTWRLQMGESGTCVGERVFLPTFGASVGIPDGHLIRVQCLNSPQTATVGQEFTVTLRVSNATQRPVNVKLVNRDNIPSSNANNPAVAGANAAGSGAQTSSNSATNTPISFSRAVSGGAGGVSALLSAIHSSLPQPGDDLANGTLTSSNMPNNSNLSSNAADKNKYLLQYNSGLCVTGLSSFFLKSAPVLNANEYTDIDITVYALASGLQELKSIVAVDMISGREYYSGSLFKTFVYEDDNVAVVAQM